jgi:hypothetical protein
VTAASPKMEAPMQRLSRNQSANVLKPIVGEKKNAASKPPGNIEFAAAPTLENKQMSKFPERKVAVSSSIRQSDRAEVERYTSRRKVSSRSGIQTSPKRKAPIRRLSKIPERKVAVSTPIRQWDCVDVERYISGREVQSRPGIQASPKREAPMRRLSRSLSTMSARYLSKSSLGGKKNAVSKPSGSAPTLENARRPIVSGSEQIMALPQQQNTTAACPKRDASMQRLSRNQSENHLKPPLGEKKNAASKTPGNIELTAAPTLENDQVAKFPERKVAVSPSNQQWDRETFEPYTSSKEKPSRLGIQKRDAFKVHRGDWEQICSIAPVQRLSRNQSEHLLKPPLRNKKTAVSKLAFAPAPTLENDQRSNVSGSEQIMALPQQQNATAAYPRREAPMQILSRNQSGNHLKPPLGEKKNAASKTPGNIEFAAAPTLENEQISKFPEGKVAASTSNQQWDRETFEH